MNKNQHNIDASNSKKIISYLFSSIFYSLKPCMCSLLPCCNAASLTRRVCFKVFYAPYRSRVGLNDLAPRQIQPWENAAPLPPIPYLNFATKSPSPWATEMRHFILVLWFRIHRMLDVNGTLKIIWFNLATFWRREQKLV